MTRQQLNLLIEIAIMLRGMSPPDTQRAIDRRLAALEQEQDARVNEALADLENIQAMSPR